MARPGQAASRKRKESKADDSDSDGYYMEDGGGQGTSKPSLRVLPVADIDDDWDGEPEDGATYLALVNRANAKLPSITRAVNPYTAPSPPPVVVGVREGEAGPPRHPGLPSEAWAVSFTNHFQNYRKHLAETLPSLPMPPYPADQPRIPDFDLRHQWVPFIKGFARRRVKRRVQHHGQGADQNEEEALVNSQAGGQPEGSETAEAEAEHEEEDEEAWMNSGQEPEPIFEDVLEDEAPKHRPREPTLAILKRLSTSQIISAILQISYDLSNTIDVLSSSLPQGRYIASQPSQPEADADAETEAEKVPDPYPPLLCRWVLALLSVLDAHLLASDVSYLRDFARVMMRVGGWRWIRGVQDHQVDSTWTLGGKGWLSASSAAEADSASVDETLARCWITIYAIAVGWGQLDLLTELEDLFKS